MKFKVTGNKLEYINDGFATTNSINFPILNFVFDDVWDGILPLLYLKSGSTELTLDIVKGEVSLPAISQNAYIGVIGDLFNTDGSVARRIATNLLLIPIQLGATPLEPVETVPQESIWTQYKATIDALTLWEPYNNTKSYVPGNKVSYEGSSYINIEGCTGVLPTDTAKWAVVASKGDKGDTGDVSVAQLASAVNNHNESETAHADIRSAIDNLISNRPISRYGILWDKVNAECTRIWDAASITTDITNFCHRGSINASYSNPFDNLMPWAGRKVCNVDIGAYVDLYNSGGNIFDAIVAWYGDPDFKWDGSNGSVMVYTPEFWIRQEETDEGVIFGVADGPAPGWIYVPAHCGGRWFGVDDGDGSIISKPGIPLINITLSTIHSKAKAKKMTLDDIYTWSADTLLMCVEYATINSQEAIGGGDASSYRQSNDHPAVSESAANRVVVTNAVAAYYQPNALLDIGTTNGAFDIARRVITSISEVDAEKKALNFDGEPLDISTDHFISAHGMINTIDAELGNASGYIGNDNYYHAYYRGQIAHAGRWRYILGAYRQKDTGKIWIAENPDDYDALNTTDHIDTGLVLPQGAGGAEINGFLNELHFYDPIPLAPFGKTIGGSSSDPIGDYVYMPSLSTEHTISIGGGLAYSGLSCGRCCVAWSNSAASSIWACAGVPFLKYPLGG